LKFAKIVGFIFLYISQLFRSRLFFSLLLILGTVYFAFEILVIPKIEPIWDAFGDPLDYHYQSHMDLYSLDFYAPRPTSFFSPRPFTTSLFYKLADSDPYKMIMLQKLTYCFCVILFALIFIFFIESVILKILTFYLLLFLFSWQNIVGWTDNILSEPTSNSLLFLWIGLLMLFVKYNNWIITILFCSLTLLFSFTRDTWPYIILISIFSIMIFDFFQNKLHIYKSGFTFLFCIGLFFFQSKSSEIGQRHKLPVFNNIVGRVCKSDEYLKWFEGHGMPMSSQIKKDFLNQKVDSENGRRYIYSKYKDSTYLPLMNWSVKDGKSIYQLFLISHPGYFFLNDQNSQQIERIFCRDFFYYFENNSKPNDPTQTTFPLWNLPTTLALVLLLFLYSIYLKNIFYAIPLLIAFVFFINALILYNADTMEVERHLYITQIIIQLLNILSFSLLINIFINLFNKKLYGI
jgi:hypothetical protein